MKDFFKKINNSVIYSCIISIVILVVIEFIQGIIENSYFSEPTGDFLKTAWMYFDFIGLWIGFLVVMALFKRNRPMLSKLWIQRKGNTLKNFGIGLLIGFLMNMTCIVVGILQGNIKVHFEGVNIFLFLIMFICVFVQSSAEELSDRGYLYERIIRSHRPITAVLASSLVFAGMHLLNPGMKIVPFMNVFISGLMYALMCYYMDSIWCAMATHTAWNFTQNILMGLPNSGQVTTFSMFKLDAASGYVSLAYDPVFGVEGSILAVIIQVIVIVGIVVLYKDKKPSIFEKRVESAES